MGFSDHGTIYMRVRGDDGELRSWHYTYTGRGERSCTLPVRLSSQAEWASL